MRAGLDRLGHELERFGAIAVALVLMLIARPVAVFLCLAPFNFQWREKVFVSWVGLRGAVGIFLASIPLLVGLPAAYLFFDVMVLWATFHAFGVAPPLAPPWWTPAAST